MVFVSNVTAAVNCVLRGLPLRSGDELLLTDHGYNACRNVADYVAGRAAARVVVASIPLPIQSPRQVVEAVLARVTDRTRLALLDHVTSPTAVVFPIAELVEELGRRGVDTLVDGAHAPGMLPLDLRRIGAAYYAGNCHKWLCAPKGAGFLHVRGDRRESLHPNVISHGYNVCTPGRSRFHDLFDWVGTIDPTPWMCVGEAIRYLGTLEPGGMEGLMQRNRGWPSGPGGCWKHASACGRSVRKRCSARWRRWRCPTIRRRRQPSRGSPAPIIVSTTNCWIALASRCR